MTPENYPVVGRFKNETAVAMTLYLEMVPEEVILEPGDEVELLAQPTGNVLPLDVAPLEDGLSTYTRTKSGTRIGTSDLEAELSRPAIQPVFLTTAEARHLKCSHRYRYA